MIRYNVHFNAQKLQTSANIQMENNYTHHRKKLGTMGN